MWNSKSHSRTFINALVGVVLLLGFGLLSASAAVNGKISASPTPFANVMTQIAQPRPTQAPATATPLVSPTPTVSAESSSNNLSLSDAQATITSQQAQINALQEQVAANKGDQGATLYAVVIIVIGVLLAFAVFFGLKPR